MESGRKTPPVTELATIPNSHQLIAQAFRNTKQTTPALAKLKPMLPWLETDVFLEDKTRAQKIIGPLGIAIGFAGAYSGYKLGSQFGLIISDPIHANSSASHFLQIYFGSVAYIPIAILIGLPTQARFQYYLGLAQKRPELPTKNNMPWVRYPGAFIAHFLSLFAGVPFVKLQYDELEPLTAIDYIVPICAVIASYCAVIYAENALKESLLNRIETDSPELKVVYKNLYDRLDSTIRVIASMPESDVSNLFKLLKEKTHPGENAAQKTSAKMKKLFTGSRIEQGNVVPAEKSMFTIFKETARDCLGYAFGGASTYVLYGLAVKTSDSAYESAEMGAIVGVLALSTNAVFTAMLGQKRAAAIYDPERSGALNLTVKGSVTQALAFCAASPSTYLAMLDANSTFTLFMAVVTFVGGGLSKELGLRYLADGSISLFEDIYRADEPYVHRKKLLKMLKKIRDAIPIMHPDQAIAFEAALAAAVSEKTQKNKVDTLIDPDARRERDTPVIQRTRDGNHLHIDVNNNKTAEGHPSPRKIVLHHQMFTPPSSTNRITAVPEEHISTQFKKDP